MEKGHQQDVNLHSNIHDLNHLMFMYVELVIINQTTLLNIFQ